MAGVYSALKTYHWQVVPIAWDGATPYLTWDIKLMMGIMDANSAYYGAVVYLYLLGFTA